MYETYHVLFVDDEENILASIKRGLMDEEYTCHFAANGFMALDLMEQFNIAVIVSDMKMPGMDGLKLLREVRERWPKCMRIVLSGYIQLPQIILSINQADIFGFIAKPWNLDELIDTIRKTLDYYILNENNEKYKNVIEAKNALYIEKLHTLESQIKVYKKNIEMVAELAKIGINLANECNDSEDVALRDILAFQTDMIDIYTSALISDGRQIPSSELTTYICDFIEEQFNITNVRRLEGNEIELYVYYEVIQSIIITVKRFLKQEFERFGISARAGINDAGKFCIYLLTLYDDNSPESRERLDRRLRFLSSIVDVFSSLRLKCFINKYEAKVLVELILK